MLIRLTGRRNIILLFHNLTPEYLSRLLKPVSQVHNHNLRSSENGSLFVPHYVNVSVLIKFSQKTSVFTLIIISSP